MVPLALDLIKAPVVSLVLILADDNDKEEDAAAAAAAVVAALLGEVVEETAKCRSKNRLLVGHVEKGEVVGGDEEDEVGEQDDQAAGLGRCRGVGGREGAAAGGGPGGAGFRSEARDNIAVSPSGVCLEKKNPLPQDDQSSKERRVRSRRQTRVWKLGR